MDTQLSRRPAGLKGRDLGVHRARVFVGQRCVLGSTLVVPTMVLWREFQTWAAANGFEPCAAALRQLLDTSPWAEVVERPEARGRFKSIVRGVGMKPTAPPGAPPGH
jgi:hypothetical protein